MRKENLFPYVLLFLWFSSMILLDALILLISQLQIQQVMTSQIRSHVEYLIRLILLCSYCSRNWWKMWP